MTRKVLRACMVGSRTVELLGTGAERRSFLHVSDCVRGLAGLAAAKLAEPVNLASCEVVTTRQLAELVADLCAFKGSLRFSGTYGGVDVRIPSIRKAQDALGWAPAITLRSGMRDLIAFVRSEVFDTIGAA